MARGGAWRSLRSPLTVCPLPLWPLDNEPFWGLCRDQHSHLTPGLTLCLTGGGAEEVRGAPHVSLLVTVSQETMG